MLSQSGFPNTAATTEANPNPPSSSDEDFISFASSSSSSDDPPEIPIFWPSDAILTLHWVMNLTLASEWASRNLSPSELPSVFPVQVFDSLILSASKILHKEPNCVTIDCCTTDSSVVVVGDVHGQLHDVIFLLRDAGFPADNRFFVFNGDYVDRGAWGLETFLLLLAWMVSMPCRGASIIAGRVYFGSLEELSKARRSVLDPPWEGLNLIPGDVLWSDPSMSPGLSPNKERGIGLLWGPDCTDEFLKKFNLKLIIRSHEGPDAREKRSDLAGMDEGYTIDHVVDSGKLITLFSAPDYPQFQISCISRFATRRYKNKGAYIVLEPPHFDSPVFLSFEAITPRPKANPYYDFEDVIDSDEELDLESMVPSS
ncbi:Serine/threonine-protein phosphatase 7 [Camellia lanceoleosa]|uniref:Serine/threonine-protein phosphatase 7 n=1 Tax=Camellia lanceoleosa TaxID=1840588 RepID=A0ACC0J2I9_9ERIC|nr:Serine/threonine-protein phosphatase 7 [Camellia lanceoleosa]